MKLTDFKLEKRKWWVILYKKTGSIIDCRSTPSQVRMNPDTDEQVPVTDDAYVFKLERALEVLLGAVDGAEKDHYGTTSRVKRKLNEALAEVQRILEKEG